MSRRSTPLIGIGAAALAVGALATFAGITNEPGKTKVGTAAAGAETATGAETSDITIPEGKQALAVALDSVAGTAGVAKAGSHIDVFAAVTKKDDSGKSSNAARMVIQNVEVLRVQSSSPLGNATAAVNKDAPAPAPSNSTVFILAVNASQAEKLVYHASFSRLWFSVIPTGQAPVPNTPGVTPANELQPEAV